jgi:hypothetical protein
MAVHGNRVRGRGAGRGGLFWRWTSGGESFSGQACRAGLWVPITISRMMNRPTYYCSKLAVCTCGGGLLPSPLDIHIHRTCTFTQVPAVVFGPTQPPSWPLALTFMALRARVFNAGATFCCTNSSGGNPSLGRPACCC